MASSPPLPPCDDFESEETISKCLHYELKNDFRDSIFSMRMASHTGTNWVAIVAIIVNLLFLLLIAIGFKQKALKSKRYLFFAGRSLIDLLVAAYSLVFIASKYTDCLSEDGLCHSTSGIFWGAEIFQTLITLDCLVISAIYSSVAALTYVAVKRPLHYQQFAQCRTVVIWLLAVFAGGLLISVVLVVFVNGTTPNGIVQLLASGAALEDTDNYGDEALMATNYDNVAFLIGPSIAFLIAIGSYGYIVAFLLCQATFNARRQKPSDVAAGRQHRLVHRQHGTPRRALSRRPPHRSTDLADNRQLDGTAAARRLQRRREIYTDRNDRDDRLVCSHDRRSTMQCVSGLFARLTDRVSYIL